MADGRDFSWAALGAVVLGGSIGVAARAALILPWGPGSHPLVVPGVTVVINVAGSFLLGLLVGRLAGRRPLLRAFLGTGMLGGFTTYSAFAVQSVDVSGAAPIVGVLLMAVSVFAGVIAGAAGLVAGRGTAAAPARVVEPTEAE